jgi:dTDP-4-dehydrorhamnose 3,5-epimerase
MKFTETKLQGSYVIEVEKIEDDRGFFGRWWCEDEFKKYNLNTNIVQANVSRSNKKGTLRGLHFQKSPHQETKLLRCTKGAVYNVIIDLRPESPTFKKWFGVKLTEDNHKMIYVPENFANGFLTLEDNSEVYYLVTEFYNKEAESGIRWNDPAFNIKWPRAITEITEKDNGCANFNFKDIT